MEGHKKIAGNRLRKSWVLILLLFLFFCYFSRADSFGTVENGLQDRLYQARGPVDTRIVIVGIDDESLKSLGRWPWPRDYHARLIRNISQGQPAVIGLDLILSEPARNGVEDADLVSTVKDAGNVVVPVYGVLGEKSRGGKIAVNELQRPFPALEAVSLGGHINTIPDSDGIVRKALLSLDAEGEIIPSFAWSIYRQYFLKMNGGQEPGQPPQDRFKRMDVAFTGKPGDYEHFSYSRVASGEIPPAYFKDKIVLVGPYAVGIEDYYFTPLAHDAPMYGIEIHANIVQALLMENYKKPIPSLANFILLAALSLSAFFAFSKLTPFCSLLVLLGLGAVYAWVAAGLYKQGCILPLFYPLALTALCYLVSLGSRYLEEMLERKRITDVFGRYVAPQVVDKILKEGEAGLQLGGSRREITALFVDIRGFTPLSESARPEEVVEILNDYLSLCARSIFLYGGTLDKFIGDAAMALYNAPLDLADHVFMAVQSAWAMKNGAAELEKKLLERFGRTVQFGIGINTGVAVVGNIGASFRMDYTAIGDTVNTAARLESNAKAGQVLLSRAAYEQVKERVLVTPLGEIQVKGKSQGIAVYQLDGIIRKKE